MRWIKASERSPDYNPVRLVHLRFSTDKTGFKLTGYYKDGQWYRQYGEEKILDWAPNLEWLDESIPTSIEDEAERLYQYDETTTAPSDSWAIDQEVTDMQRSAHITAARQYMGEIEKLRAENEKMRKALEDCCNDYNELQEQSNRWKEESGR